jgi:hypothetical protein
MNSPLIHATHISPLANGWFQVSFSQYLALRQGMRFCMGTHLLAPWRWQGNNIDCLVLPSEQPIDPNQAITIDNLGDQIGIIEENTRYLLTGEGLAIADVLLLAQHYRPYANQILLCLAADCFPFAIKPARFMVSELPHLIAACPLLEDWGFANRLASETGLPGCFEGDLKALLSQLNLTLRKTETSLLLRRV